MFAVTGPDGSADSPFFSATKEYEILSYKLYGKTSFFVVIIDNRVHYDRKEGII